MKTEKGLNEWDSGLASFKRSSSEEVKYKRRRYMCQEQGLLSGEGGRLVRVEQDCTAHSLLLYSLNIGME